MLNEEISKEDLYDYAKKLYEICMIDASKYEGYVVDEQDEYFKYETNILVAE